MLQNFNHFIVLKKAYWFWYIQTMKNLKIAKKLIIFIAASFYTTLIYSQEYEYKPKSVVRVITENDFWMFKNRTDIYYTQGLKIEYLKDLPETAKFSKWWPFLFANNTQNIKGISVGQNLYTSSDISIPSIMENDRPYGAWLYVSIGTISNNENSKKRLTTNLYLGVLGPIALGEEVQSTFHKWIDSTPPEGWPNQIKNDVGINFSIKYEKGIFSLCNENFNFDFVPNMELQTGTVFNIVSLGSTTRLSIFNSSNYFENAFGNGDIPKLFKTKVDKTFSKKPSFFKSFKMSNFSVFIGNSVNLVMWNSFLQGGVFSQDSPYLVENNDVKRLYFNFDYGISYSNPYFNLTYSRVLRTKEFEQQERNHKWGKFQILIKL